MNDRVDDAALIPLGSKISSTVKDGINFWFAFRTTADESASYKLTAVHETQTSDNSVTFSLYDGYGNEIRSFQAGSDGAASTLEISGLEPDTLYYIAACCFNNRSDTLDYTLAIKVSEAAEAPSATVEPAGAELVFETPHRARRGGARLRDAVRAQFDAGDVPNQSGGVSERGGREGRA